MRRAVPTGSVRAAHGDRVLRALATTPQYARSYANRQATLRTVLGLLILRADYETMTTRPGWKYLCDKTGKTRRTIARALADLRAWGLLGIVATGRTAQYASLREDGQRTNEAAVYVLCTPSHHSRVPSPTNPDVDELGTPPAVGGPHLKILKKPIHAREKKPTTERLRRTKTFPAAPPPPTPLTPYRPELLWPAHKTTASKKQRLAAATELRRRVFLLRPMTTKDIASSIRDFLLCGWTVADLHHALDFRPDGTPWPHSGGVPADANAPRLRGWLRHRLNAWRTTTGEPLRSRDQQRHNAATEARAAAIKAVRDAKKELETRATRRGQDSPAKVLALATIRAMLGKESP